MWIAIIIGILLLILIFVGFGMKFQKSDQGIQTYFQEKGVDYHFQMMDSPQGKIRTLQTGNTASDTVILMLHGAPGALDAFLGTHAHKKLNQKYLLISMDRLGYGKSNYGKAQPSIEKQAEAVLSVMKAFPDKKFVLIGHSFGAPVVALVGKKEPQKTLKVILAGGAISAERERFEWLAKINLSTPIRWISSPDNLVASREKVKHAEELNQLKTIWKDYPIPIVFWHGDKDWMVPFTNVEDISKLTPKANTTIKKLAGEGHLFVFVKVDLFNNLLVEAMGN